MSYSPTILDKMSISDIVKHIQMLSNEIDCSIDCSPNSALDYCNDLSVFTSLLQDRIEEYLEDEETV
jgi:hypothetical protein